MSGEQKFKGGRRCFSAARRRTALSFSSSPTAVRSIRRGFRTLTMERPRSWETIFPASSALTRERASSPRFSRAITREICSSSLKTAECAKVELSGYATKTNRRKLTGAYSDKEPVSSAVLELPQEEGLRSTPPTAGRLFSPRRFLPRKRQEPRRALRSWALKKEREGCARTDALGQRHRQSGRYRAKSLPAAGALLRQEGYGGTANLT